MSNPSAATSELLDLCIALKKSGTGVEGSAAEDKGRCLGVPGGDMVEETKRRLARAGVRVGSGGVMDQEGARFDWYDSRCSVHACRERSVSTFRLPSDENGLGFGFGGGVGGGLARVVTSLTCEGDPFLLSGIEVPLRVGWSGDGGQVFCLDGGWDSGDSPASVLGMVGASGGVSLSAMER